MDKIVNNFINNQTSPPAAAGVRQVLKELNKYENVNKSPKRNSLTSSSSAVENSSEKLNKSFDQQSENHTHKDLDQTIDFNATNTDSLCGLASNFNNLVLSTTENDPNFLSVTTTHIDLNSSQLSSDDELFVDCNSINESGTLKTANVQTPIDGQLFQNSHINEPVVHSNSLNEYLKGIETNNVELPSAVFAPPQHQPNQSFNIVEQFNDEKIKLSDESVSIGENSSNQSHDVLETQAVVDFVVQNETINLNVLSVKVNELSTNVIDEKSAVEIISENLDDLYVQSTDTTNLNTTVDVVAETGNEIPKTINTNQELNENIALAVESQDLNKTVEVIQYVGINFDDLPAQSRKLNKTVEEISENILLDIESKFEDLDKTVELIESKLSINVDDLPAQSKNLNKTVDEIAENILLDFESKLENLDKTVEIIESKLTDLDDLAQSQYLNNTVEEIAENIVLDVESKLENLDKDKINTTFDELPVQTKIEQLPLNTTAASNITSPELNTEITEGDSNISVQLNIEKPGVILQGNVNFDDLPAQSKIENQKLNTTVDLSCENIGSELSNLNKTLDILSESPVHQHIETTLNTTVEVINPSDIVEAVKTESQSINLQSNLPSVEFLINSVNKFAHQIPQNINLIADNSNENISVDQINNVNFVQTKNESSEILPTEIQSSELSSTFDENKTEKSFQQTTTNDVSTNQSFSIEHTIELNNTQPIHDLNSEKGDLNSTVNLPNAQTINEQFTQKDNAPAIVPTNKPVKQNETLILHQTIDTVAQNTSNLKVLPMDIDELEFANTNLNFEPMDIDETQFLDCHTGSVESDLPLKNEQIDKNLQQSEISLNADYQKAANEQMEQFFSSTEEKSETVEPKSKRLSLSIRQDLYPSSDNKDCENLTKPTSVKNSAMQNENNVFVEDNFRDNSVNVTFKTPFVPSMASSSTTAASSISSFQKMKQQQPNNIIPETEEFSSNGIIFDPEDFDFLLTKGKPQQSILNDPRSSLLLRFDPLVRESTANHPHVYQQPQQHQTLGITTEEEVFYEPPNSTIYTSKIDNNNDSDEHLNLNDTLPLPELYNNNSGDSADDLPATVNHTTTTPSALNSTLPNYNFLNLTQSKPTDNAMMSVGLIQDIKSENDCKPFVISEKESGLEMAELERKFKNEMMKSSDVEKKLKEAETREESFLKRITEKDKTITKLNGVMEAYEKSIAELLAEKEQNTQNYDKQINEIKTDRDLNFKHLNSLETTFSDLHAKYERSKQSTIQLKEQLDELTEDNKRTVEQLALQEKRYEKMKNHALQQLENANSSLESLTKNHAVELTKLKAQLKKEEISRQSINEQLAHKTKENEELVKICDELISGQGS